MNSMDGDGAHMNHKLGVLIVALFSSMFWAPTGSARADVIFSDFGPGNTYGTGYSYVDGDLLPCFWTDLCWKIPV